MVEAGDDFPARGEEPPIVLEENLVGSEAPLNPDGIFAAEETRYTEPEAIAFERAMYNMTFSNLGNGPPLLPWEQGVFAQIFAPESSNGLPDTLSVAPAPAPLVAAEKGPEESEAFVDRATPGVSTLPLFAKHFRALCDRDFSEAQKLNWTRPLASWLTVLESSAFEPRVGEHVLRKLAAADRDGALLTIRDACGVRSPATVLKHAR